MTTNSHFQIGDGVGLVGRWFRLLIGAYFLVFLVLNPILLHPIPRADLLAFGGKVGLSLAAIVAIYFVVFYAIGAGTLKNEPVDGHPRVPGDTDAPFPARCAASRYPGGNGTVHQRFAHVDIFHALRRV